MKIIIFPVKFDKFTGFFDKFLKRMNPINGCNKTGYYINMSVQHSDMAPKQFFGARAFPRNCPHLRARAREVFRGFTRARTPSSEPSLWMAASPRNDV